MGWRPPLASRRVQGAAAPSTPEDTPSGGPGDWSWGESEAETEFESASEEAGGV